MAVGMSSGKSSEDTCATAADAPLTPVIDGCNHVILHAGYKKDLQTWWAAKSTDPNYDTLKNFDLCHAGIASKEPFARDRGIPVSRPMLRLLLKHEDGGTGAPLRAFQKWARELLDAHKEADAWERAVLLWDRLCWMRTRNEEACRKSLLSLTERRMEWQVGTVVLLLLTRSSAEVALIHCKCCMRCMEQAFKTVEGEGISRQTLGAVLGQGGQGVVIRGSVSLGDGQSASVALKYMICEGTDVCRRAVTLRSALTEVGVARLVANEAERLSPACLAALCLPRAFGKLQLLCVCVCVLYPFRDLGLRRCMQRTAPWTRPRKH